MRLKATAQYKSNGSPGIDFAAIQAFHTENVLKRIGSYMPYRSGAFRKLMLVQTDINKPYIVVSAPHAPPLYRGFRYLQSGGQSAPYKYSTAANAKAGPNWDKFLVQQQGKALVADLQRFVDSGRATK